MRRLAWPLMLTVLVVSLAVGSFTRPTERATSEQRVDRIAAEIRCPTCAGLSVAESESPLAQSARNDIARRVAAGESDADIKAFFVSVYGAGALMSPPREGVTWVPWALPVLATLAAVGAVALLLRRWRQGKGTGGPSDDDRRLVAEALEARR